MQNCLKIKFLKWLSDAVLKPVVRLPYKVLHGVSFDFLQPEKSTVLKREKERDFLSPPVLTPT